MFCLIDRVFPRVGSFRHCAGAFAVVAFVLRFFRNGVLDDDDNDAAAADDRRRLCLLLLLPVDGLEFGVTRGIDVDDTTGSGLGEIEELKDEGALSGVTSSFDWSWNR